MVISHFLFATHLLTQLLTQDIHHKVLSTNLHLPVKWSLDCTGLGLQSLALHMQWTTIDLLMFVQSLLIHNCMEKRQNQLIYLKYTLVLNSYFSNNPNTFNWPCAPDQISILWHLQYLRFLETAIPEFVRVSFCHLSSRQLTWCHFKWTGQQSPLILPLSAGHCLHERNLVRTGHIVVMTGLIFKYTGVWIAKKITICQQLKSSLLWCAPIICYDLWGRFFISRIMCFYASKPFPQFLRLWRSAC